MSNLDKNLTSSQAELEAPVSRPMIENKADAVGADSVEVKEPKTPAELEKMSTLQRKGNKKPDDKNTKDAKLGKDGKPVAKKGLNKQQMILAGVALGLFLVILFGWMYMSNKSKQEAEALAAAEAQALAQQQAEEQAKLESEQNKTQTTDVLRNTIGLMAQQQPNHWIFITPQDTGNPNATKDRLVRTVVEGMIMQEPRFLQGQGLKVNGDAALLPITDPRLSTRLSRVEQETAIALSAYTFEPFTDETNVPLVSYAIIKDNTGRVLETPEDFAMLENNLMTAGRMAWQKALNEIDNDPTVVNGGQGILSLQPEQQQEKSEVQESMADAERKHYENHIENLNKVISKMDERLAEEVSNTRRAEQQAREQVTYVANIIQRIEDSPNATNALKAYDLNKYLKSEGLKVDAVVGDLVYLHDKQGNITVKKMGDILKLNGTSVQLVDVDQDSGIVMVVPR